jgi:glycosyltransferase involved in cell wall biosynthesis
METTAPGGINKAVMELAKNLSKKDHNILVLQPNPFNLPEEQTIDNFKIIRVKSRIEKYSYGLSISIYLFLKKNFEKLNPDIVHIHGYHSIFTPWILLILKKILKTEKPIIFTPHYDPLNHSRLVGKIFGGLYDQVMGKVFLKSFNYVISISDYEANNIKRLCTLDNITIIPPMIA